MEIAPVPADFRAPAMCSLLVQGDSKLTVNQVNGVWRVHKEHLTGVCDENQRLCHELLKVHGVKLPGKKAYFLEQVPRARNREADVLANQAMDTRSSSQAWVKLADEFAGQSTSHYLLTFDGGARQNPGPAGCGAKLSLCDEAGNAKAVIWSGYEFISDHETNNVAEHRGLLLGLRAATAVARLRPAQPQLTSFFPVNAASSAATSSVQRANGGS
jgi:ribonuclease HI